MLKTFLNALRFFNKTSQYDEISAKSKKEALKTAKTLNQNYLQEQSFKQAVVDGNKKAVQVYLKEGMNPYIDGGVLLIEASNKGYTDIVKLLLDYAKTIPKTNTYRATDLALMKATIKGYTNIVKMLLDRQDFSNLRKVFLLAKAYNQTEIMDLLLNFPELKNFNTFKL